MANKPARNLLAIHEAGHAVAAKILGLKIAGGPSIAEFSGHVMLASPPPQRMNDRLARAYTIMALSGMMAEELFSHPTHIAAFRRDQGEESDGAQILGLAVRHGGASPFRWAMQCKAAARAMLLANGEHVFRVASALERDGVALSWVTPLADIRADPDRWTHPID